MHYLELLGILVEEDKVNGIFDGLDEHGKELANEEDMATKGLEAKLTICKQIAGLVSVDAADVFLYPSGMTAIWSTHQLLMRVFDGSMKSVCFG